MKRGSENGQVAGSRRWRAAIHDNGRIPIDPAGRVRRGRPWTVWLILTGLVLVAIAATILAPVVVAYAPNLPELFR